MSIFERLGLNTNFLGHSHFDSEILFFIILFLLLFWNPGHDDCGCRDELVK